ncbi:MAG: IS66 family transposase [Candidatus Latescibacterota bacterium]
MGEDLRRLSRRQLIHLVEQLVERVAVLEQRSAALEGEVARLRRDSSTSSKPPSSDIVKPPKSTPARGGGKRRAGGQPGHERHERTSFSPEQLDATWEYSLTACPDCGGPLRAATEPPRVVQQVELVERPVRLEEHRATAHWCPRCRQLHWSPLPAEVVHGGLVGSRLTAHLGYLKGACHASYRTLQKYAEDVLGVALSTGQLAKVIGKVTAALAAPYEQLRQALPTESRLNVDETGHPEKGAHYWTWCFRAPGYTLFKIDPSRGSEVLLEVLGPEFAGVIGADYFSAYRKYMGDCGVLVQFCLAHLIRDVKYLTTLTDKATQRYGQNLLARLRALFQVIHRRQRLSAAAFQRALERARKKLVFTATHPPCTCAADNLAERFRQHADAYFRFITTPGLEPTNNLAEQAIRFVVIDRRITQGTRGEAGRRWSERIWTTIATCAQQGRSVWHFLEQAVHAHVTGQPAPSLLLLNSC